MVRKASVVVGLVCFGVLLGCVVALGQDGEDRRVKAVREAQYADMAHALNLGEMALRVSSSGVVDVLAAGKYCGIINLPPGSLDSETYRQRFFAQLDELLRKETGYRIWDFTDLFLFFDSDVSEEEVTRQRDLFQRHEPCYYNCCTAEHAYRCCPSRISPWFLRVPDSPPPNWVSVVRCIQYLKVYEITRVNVLVISDGTSQEFGVLGGEKRVGTAALLAWLRTLASVTSVYELRLGVSPGQAVSLVGELPAGAETQNAVMIVILTYDRSRYGALADTIEDAVLEEIAGVQGNPVVVLLAFSDPSVGSVSLSLFSLFGRPVRPVGGGAILVSATTQPGSVLQEILTAIDMQRVSMERLQAFAVIIALRVYGFVVYSDCMAYPVRR